MEINQAVAELDALAQATRLDIFRTLVRAGPGGLAAGQIAKRFGLPAPTLSFHLAQLRGAGLVERRREGRRLLYSADYGAIRELVAYLFEQCCAAEPGSSRGRRPGRRGRAR